MLYILILKNHIPKKWSQDVQVPEIKKNAMLFSIRLTGNVDPHNYTNTSGAMDNELDVPVLLLVEKDVVSLR